MQAQKLELLTENQNSADFQFGLLQNSSSFDQKEKSFQQNVQENSLNKFCTKQNIKNDLHPFCDQFDQQQLIRLYAEHGSKWVKIANFFKEKSDNFVKNRFYSRLRRSVRLLNRQILTHYKLTYKLINLNIIFKLVNLVQRNLFKEQIVSQEIINYYSKLLQELIEVSAKKIISKQQKLNLSKTSQEIPDLTYQDIICSFEALQSMWKYLGSNKKKKTSSRRTVKYINNRKFKLSAQSDQHYLVITNGKCYLTDSNTADEMLRAEFERQISRQKHQPLISLHQNFNQNKTKKISRKQINCQRNQRLQQENYDQASSQRMEFEDYFSSEQIQNGKQENQIPNRYPQLQNFNLNSPSWTQVTEWSYEMNNQSSQILQIYAIDQENYNSRSIMDLFDQNIQTKEQFFF